MTDGTGGLNHGGAKNHIYADRLGSPIFAVVYVQGIGLPLFVFCRGKNELNSERSSQLNYALRS